MTQKRAHTPERLHANYHLTWNQFQIAFSKVVPVFEAMDDPSVDREAFTTFVKKKNFGKGATIPKAQTGMKQKVRVSAIWLYALTVFFALWQGPTQSEPFCPSWPGHFPPILIQLNGHMSVAKWHHQEGEAMLYLAAQETHNLYRHCMSGWHHCLHLLN